MEMERWYVDFDYNKILSVSENLKQKLKNNKAELNLTDQFVFSDLLARSAFRAKKYSDALSYSVELLNHPEVLKKFQNYNCAHLFNLLIYFELGNFDLLDY